MKVRVKAKERASKRISRNGNNSHKPSIRALGWTKEETVEARARLISFEDDWNAPGMEAYDKI